MKKVLLVAVLTISLGCMLGAMFATDASAFFRRGHATWYGMGWWGMTPYWGCGWGYAPYYAGWCGPAWCGPCCPVVTPKGKGKPVEKKAPPKK